MIIIIIIIIIIISRLSGYPGRLNGTTSTCQPGILPTINITVKGEQMFNICKTNKNETIENYQWNRTCNVKSAKYLDENPPKKRLRDVKNIFTLKLMTGPLLEVEYNFKLFNIFNRDSLITINSSRIFTEEISGQYPPR